MWIYAELQRAGHLCQACQVCKLADRLPKRVLFFLRIVKYNLLKSATLAEMCRYFLSDASSRAMGGLYDAWKAVP